MTTVMSPADSPAQSPSAHREDDIESTVSTAAPVISWRQFLLRDYDRRDDDPALKDDFFWSMILLLGWFVVIVVVTVTMVQNWPSETDVYNSNDAVPREGYACACSLPLNLQDPDKPEKANTTLNFNQCYPRGSLETISVLQYSTNNTGIDDIVRQYATKEVLYRESEGFVVSQEAHELTIGADYWRSEKARTLKKLYRNDQIGFADEDILFPLEGYILRASFMSFPNSYVRMAFQYTCLNCSSCGRAQIDEHIKNVTGEGGKWVSCYYFNRNASEQCSQSTTSYPPMTYDGKCVLYPTRTVPFAFAIKTFILAMNTTAGIDNITTVSPATRLLNYASVQANVVYLNRSTVTQGILRYGFVESQRGSTLRAWLLSRLPNSDTECSEIPDVRNSNSVCNGSSICNAFINADQSIQLKCQAMSNGSACRDLVTNTSLMMDNMPNDTHGDSVEQICSSPPFSCLTTDSDKAAVPAFKVTRFATAGTNDPINEYLNYTTLENDWLQLSGICTKTYKQVYRYNDTMFLQAECTNRTDLCKLTGKFHLLDDFFQEERRLDPRFFFNASRGGELFVCFRMRQKEWSLWFLDYVNTLFSWLSVLIFLYVSGLYKLVRFVKAKYGYGHDHDLIRTTSDSMSSRWLGGHGRRKSADHPSSINQATISSDGSRQRHARPRSTSALGKLKREVSMAVRSVPPVSLPDESSNDEVRLFTTSPSA